MTNQQDPLAKFPQGVRLTIDVVFVGEYRIGYQYANVHYIPGTPSYYPCKQPTPKDRGLYP